MGCCHSYSRLEQDSVTNRNNIQKSYKKSDPHIQLINTLFNFDFKEPDFLYKKLKGFYGALITGKFSYDFTIMDYNEVCALAFIFETYNKNINKRESSLDSGKGKYRISYTSEQIFKGNIGNDYIYVFWVHIQFTECSLIQLCLCLITLLDLIPHEFFVKKYCEFNPATADTIMAVTNRLNNKNPINFSEHIQFKNVIFDNYVNGNYGTFELNTYRNSNECVICLERVRNKLTMPCMHYSMCGRCSGQIRICPICRVSITESITVITV